MNLEVQVLEDNKEYAIIDTIKINGIKYIYFSQVENPKINCIRKYQNNEENIVGLDTDLEYEQALKVFTERFDDLFS